MRVLINKYSGYKRLVLALFMGMISVSGFSFAPCNVYFFTYATRNGRTGHSALAVENYTIYVNDRIVNNTIVHEYDTIKTGNLTYFDFWPEKDYFSIRNVGKNTVAKYNRLPSASYDMEITLDYIKRNGIPHIHNYPCDGILMLKTKPVDDYRLVRFMDSIIRINRPFNVRKFNCSDFVLSGASFITKAKIRAKEFIPFSFSTTPNRLYKKLSRLAGIQVIIDAGDRVRGKFFKERVLEILFAKKKDKRHN